MKSFIKVFLSQKLINIFYHLPMAILANFFYGFPTKSLKVIGVTGTDGKTTTVNMIYQILKDSGKKVSMVSTINAVVAGKQFDTGFHVTSPDPFTIQKFARDAAGFGDEYLVLEVTSHSLDQYRFWGIDFEIGVITNITRDHLDYHETIEDYRNTKLKLIKNAKHAVVNNLTFGLNEGEFNQKELKLKLKIPGEYNILNALAAFAVCCYLGIDRQSSIKSLAKFSNLKGRFEEIKNNKKIRIVVDFAHTPNALENILKTLRQDTTGRLISVFGAAGKRDKGKRAIMGEIAQRLSDIVIIAPEDPRGELEEINKQILAGATKANGVLGENLFVVDDRSMAIDFAINKIAKVGDTIGIFGKGHEQSMNMDGKSEIPWSDVKAVESSLINK